MPALLFTPQTQIQLAWLLKAAKAQGIPYFEFVQPSRKGVPHSDELSFLKELTCAGKQARKIVSGKLAGKNAYDLAHEL